MENHIIDHALVAVSYLHGFQRWRHVMEFFSAKFFPYGSNIPINSLLFQRPIMQNFDDFFVVSLMDNLKADK